MVIKVGINGFGRIGRIVSRACLQNADLELSAINDPAISVEYVCYLMKFDSTHGKLQWSVSHHDHEIAIDGRHVKVFHEKLPPSIPWRSAGVQYVVEASGMFTNLEKASGHLTSEGVKRVIVTAPSVDIPMIILGVNDDNISSERKVISCTSSTLYCLAPIIKVLEDCFGVKDGFITSIHAMTPSLKPLDGLCLRGRQWRDHRGIHQNIIPATTGACKALGKILPQVKDKLSGLAFRVPIVNVSVLDLTIRLKTFTNLRDIAKSVEQASKTALKNIMKMSNEESVSSDFIGDSHSCVFDEDSSMQLKPDFFKLICWYENEYSYACRVVDTIIFSEHQIALEIPIKITSVKQMPKKNLVIQTECFEEETFAVCGKPEINSKIISSTNQVIKVEPRPLLVKKHSSASIPSSHTSRKANELFRIWNDSNENSKPKQNKTEFFQRCMACALPQKKVECNAQERLANVKKEFTKMVNITEDLLKITFSNQSNIQQTTKVERKGLNEKNIKSKEDICKGDAEICRKFETHTPVEECGDHKSVVVICDTSRTQNDSSKDQAECLMSDDKSNSASEINKNISENTKKNIEIAKLGKNVILNNDIQDNLTSTTVGITTFNGALAKPNLNSKSKQQLTKTINTLIDELTQNIQVQSVCNNRKIKITTAIEEEKITKEMLDKSHTHFSNPAPDHVPFEKKSNSSQTNDFEKREAKTDIKISQHKLDDHIKVIDEELRKRSIILVDSTFVSETESEVYDENGAYAKNIGKKVYNLVNPCCLPNKILKGIAYSSDLIAKVPDDAPKFIESPANVLSCVPSSVYGNKPDIFDKLDSASGSNSNNSFEVNERESQVLQIADLTNSLEDLARLDNICRIIEISDEMSDKLFSALDDEIVDRRGNALKKRRWSFRDFCERIKLDEFCNKVFGEVSHHQSSF